MNEFERKTQDYQNDEFENNNLKSHNKSIETDEFTEKSSGNINSYNNVNNISDSTIKESTDDKLQPENELQIINDVNSSVETNGTVLDQMNFQSYEVAPDENVISDEFLSSEQTNYYQQQDSAPVISEDDSKKNNTSEHMPDSYYVIPSTPPVIDVVETKTKPKKRKRYISASVAVIALVITSLVSVAGSVIISKTGVFDDIFSFATIDNSEKNSSNTDEFSVEDNFNNSKSNNGIKVENDLLNGESLSTPEIVDKVGPAVVGIINKTTYGNAYGNYGFFGNLDEEIEQSSGSGVIISSDGYIVTNNHVIENSTKIMVILNNGQEYEAKLVGGDSRTDLAVIKIESTGLPYAQMGISSDLRVGQTAIAIGNPLGQEFAGTTTQGIISGLNRSVTIDNKTMNLIQTDAAINPGNSGGALVNDKGMLIGINTAKISSDTLEGLGFAIPIDEAKPIIEELIQNGYVTGRPVIGIGGRAVTEQDAKAYNMRVGVYVSTLTPNGPAHLAGVNVGDIIIECDSEPVETVDDINEIKNKKSPGDIIKLKIFRKGSEITLDLILGEEMPG